MTAVLVGLCLAVVVVSLLGGFLPLMSVLTHTRLQLYLSFAAGVMLGAAFFHMMPEAIHLGSVGALHWTAAGLLSLFFLERFLRSTTTRLRPTRPSLARRIRTSTRMGGDTPLGWSMPRRPVVRVHRTRGLRCTGERRPLGSHCIP